MTAILAKYLAKPTEANAKRVVAYATKHPFAECLLDTLERGVLLMALNDVGKRP